MVSKRDFVTMNVDKAFFDNLFEPSRIKAQQRLGLKRLGQKDFSAMIFKSGIKLDIKMKDIGGISELQKRNKRKKR